MAILKGIKVVIRVDGQELKEYDDEDASNDYESSVSKCVEATSGAEFQIVTSAPIWCQNSSEGLAMKIYLDGTYVEHSLPQREKARWTGARKWAFDGARRFNGNRWEVKPFKFTEIKTVENDSQIIDNTSESSHIKDLGTINIEVHHQKMFGKRPVRSWGIDQNIGGASVFTEKQLKGKGVTHSVALGDVRKCTGPLTIDAVDGDGDIPPVAKFTFKYRSRKALQALLLIPRSPSPPREPTPLPLEERDIEDLTPEQMRELVRRQQARYRMEHDTIKKVPERGIKRERDPEYDELIRSAVTKKAKTRPCKQVIELD